MSDKKIERKFSEEGWDLERKILIEVELFSPSSVEKFEEMYKFLMFSAAPEVGSFNDEEIDNLNNVVMPKPKSPQK